MTSCASARSSEPAPGPSRAVGLFAVLLLLVGAGCTTTTVADPTPAPARPIAPDEGETNAGTSEPEPTTDACGAVAASKCKPANEGSVIRGIVKFDKTKVKVSTTTKPKLRVFLHHQVILRADENKTGGHPHAWKSFDLDMEKGEARFTLDLCEFGVAMYSEENCGFNLVVMIDDAGLNDPDKKGATALVPRAGKLVKMTPLEVSCHASSPCFEITADCTDGDACTTYDAPTKCSTCAANSCPSDDALCKP